MDYTPENIIELKPNQRFVFGSNGLGIHKKGAALIAYQKFGAIIGQSQGPQGQSYAIITKMNWREEKSSSLKQISEQIYLFLEYANIRSDLEFLVTKLGSSLAGYSIKEIGDIFRSFEIPVNVILPFEYSREFINN